MTETPEPPAESGQPLPVPAEPPSPRSRSTQINYKALGAAVILLSWLVSVALQDRHASIASDVGAFEQETRLQLEASEIAEEIGYLERLILRSAPAPNTSTKIQLNLELVVAVLKDRGRTLRALERTRDLLSGQGFSHEKVQLELALADLGSAMSQAEEAVKGFHAQLVSALPAAEAQELGRRQRGDFLNWVFGNHTVLDGLPEGTRGELEVQALALSISVVETTRARAREIQRTSRIALVDARKRAASRLRTSDWWAFYSRCVALVLFFVGSCFAALGEYLQSG